MRHEPRCGGCCKSATLIDANLFFKISRSVILSVIRCGFDATFILLAKGPESSRAHKKGNAGSVLEQHGGAEQVE
jgi:hypothetical protein